MSASENEPKWLVPFRPEESAAAPNLHAFTETFHWSIHAVAGMLGILLIIYGANRAKTGNTDAAIKSFIGAVIVASAPVTARLFIP